MVITSTCTVIITFVIYKDSHSDHNFVLFLVCCASSFLISWIDFEQANKHMHEENTWFLAHLSLAVRKVWLRFFSNYWCFSTWSPCFAFAIAARGQCLKFHDRLVSARHKDWAPAKWCLQYPRTRPKWRSIKRVGQAPWPHISSPLLPAMNPWLELVYGHICVYRGKLYRTNWAEKTKRISGGSKNGKKIFDPKRE